MISRATEVAATVSAAEPTRSGSANDAGGSGQSGPVVDQQLDPTS